jgi:predicted AAA+ superfamily ATPase
MKRRYLDYLREWKFRSNRKPLILRGARQVGKTHLVRSFSESDFDNIIEINFDESPEKSELFQSSDMGKILEYIALDSDSPLIPGKTLLFLDEIQCVPEIIAKLRYFYEKCRSLHIIAAGSLLDFVLEDHTFSMPVGRVEYMFIGPMDFCEFLEAHSQVALLDFIRAWNVEEQVPLSIHKKLLDYQRIYVAIGGMPAAVREHINNDSFIQCEQEQAAIIQAYQDDFSKYQKRVHSARLKTVLEKLPHLVGNKLKYVDISRDERAKDLAESIRMLQMARVIYCIHHSSGNALPLRYEKKEKDFKPLFLDSGLMMRSLNMKLTDLLDQKLLLANHGALAEQFIGQQLLYKEIGYQEPELYYWNREQRGAVAEVDYLLQVGVSIVPIEVKAGTTGSLKSLHVFAQEKNSPLAVRFNIDQPTIHEVESNVIKGKHHRYKLLSLPLYMVSETARLCRSILGE